MSIDIDKLAEEAGSNWLVGGHYDDLTDKALARFVASVIEQCALVCEGVHGEQGIDTWRDYEYVRARCAAAIRALKPPA